MAMGWDSIRSVDGTSINIARAAIHAFTFQDQDLVVPVHTNKLSAFFRRYYPNNSVTSPLDVLHLLKEVISLPNGMWLPAPCRSIDICGEESLLIAPHPTNELERSLQGKLKRLQFGRTYDGTPNQAFVKISIETWSEAIPSLSRWMENFVKVSVRRLQETVTTGRTIQVRNSWNNVNPHMKNAQSWYSYSKSSGIPDGVHLCQELAQGTPIRKFVGDFRAGTLRRECDLSDEDATLFRFGLEQLRNKPLALYSTKVANGRKLRISCSLPRSETMILTGLGSEFQKADLGTLITFEDRAFSVVRSALQRIGIVMREHQ